MTGGEQHRGQLVGTDRRGPPRIDEPFDDSFGRGRADDIRQGGVRLRAIDLPNRARQRPNLLRRNKAGHGCDGIQ